MSGTPFFHFSLFFPYASSFSTFPPYYLLSNLQLLVRAFQFRDSPVHSLGLILAAVLLRQQLYTLAILRGCPIWISYLEKAPIWQRNIEFYGDIWWSLFYFFVAVWRASCQEYQYWCCCILLIPWVHLCFVLQVAEKTALLRPVELKLVPLSLEGSAFRNKFLDADELMSYAGWFAVRTSLWYFLLVLPAW